MTRANTPVREIDWPIRPLCCRYFLMAFETLSVEADESGVVYERPLQWAIGVLADGQHEVAGVWPGPMPCAPNWQEIFEDLRVRGVERIRFASACDSTGLATALDVAFPGAAVLPTGRQIGAAVAPSPRHRRTALATGAVMRRLRIHAGRAVMRHGCFSGPAEATAFVTDVLERGLQRSGRGAASLAAAPRASLPRRPGAGAEALS